MSDFTFIFQTAFPIVLTAIVGYLVTRQQKKDDDRDRKEEERDEGRKKRAEKVDEIYDKIEQIMNSQLEIKEDCRRLNASQQELMDTQSKIKTGLKISLQDDLLKNYNVFADNNNKMSSDDYDHWVQTYNAYHDLEGNSFCEKLNDRVERMEIVFDEDHTKDN